MIPVSNPISNASKILDMQSKQITKTETGYIHHAGEKFTEQTKRNRYGHKFNFSYAQKEEIFKFIDSRYPDISLRKIYFIIRKNINFFDSSGYIVQKDEFPDLWRELNNEFDGKKSEFTKKLIELLEENHGNISLKPSDLWIKITGSEKYKQGQINFVFWVLNDLKRDGIIEFYRKHNAAPMEISFINKGAE